jgi:pyruvate/2-oxoglutarate dehydrogenase complex dihydrolipoamide acyltransferase (E2) component
MRKALASGPLQRLAQVRRLAREHGDDLVEVAVGGGPRDAVVAGQRIGGGTVAEPPQAHHGLPKAGQHPAAVWGAAPVALGQQQLGNELSQFPGDVKRGTIGDHVEPSAEG